MSADQEPRVGCGGVIVERGRILLGKRRRPPEAGCWGLFGGKLDWLETTRAAVEREIAEEIGLQVRATQLLCVVDQVEMDPPSHWVSTVYLTEVIAGEPSIREPDAIEAIGWFEAGSLPSPLTMAASTALAALSAFRADPSLKAWVRESLQRT